MIRFRWHRRTYRVYKKRRVMVFRYKGVWRRITIVGRRARVRIGRRTIYIKRFRPSVRVRRRWRRVTYRRGKRVVRIRRKYRPIYIRRGTVRYRYRRRMRRITWRWRKKGRRGRRGEKDFFFRQPRQRNPGCLSERGWEGPSFMVRVSWKYCDIGERLLY